MSIMVFFSLIIAIVFLGILIEDFSRCYWWISTHKDHEYYNKNWFEKTAFCLCVMFEAKQYRIKKTWEDICLFIPKMARRRAFFLKNAQDREFVPSDEMDESLDMDGAAMLYLKPEEKKKYIDNLMRRRREAHERTLH